jgi:hypothetical protein
VQATELASRGWAVVAVEHPHDGFTDSVVLMPQALAADPAVGAGTFDTQVETVAEGLAVVAAQRRFLAGFFDRYLPGAGR